MEGYTCTLSSQTAHSPQYSVHCWRSIAADLALLLTTSHVRRDADFLKVEQDPSSKSAEAFKSKLVGSYPYASACVGGGG